MPKTYYCNKCKTFHKNGKIYQEHKEFKADLTDSEIWKLQFKQSWKSYQIDSHKDTRGSKNQLR